MFFALARSRFNVLAVGASFAVIFSAYNPLQNYISSLIPGTLGQQSLAVLYTVCAVSVFAAPAVTARWGAKLTMIFGAACYVVYMLALLDLTPALVLSASAVIGFGSALLWVAVGIFITENSTRETYGFNSGLFWSIFQVNAVVGNLVTWAVFPSLSSTATLYLGFAIIAAVGTCGLFSLRAPDARGDARAAAIAARRRATRGKGSSGDGVRGVAQQLLADIEAEEEVAAAVAAAEEAVDAEAAGAVAPLSEQTLAEAARGAWRAATLLTRVDMLLLLPVFFFSGAELAFWTGEFTQQLPVSSIGLVLTCAGIGEIAGGVALGRLSDKSRSASLLLAVLLYGVGLLLSGTIRAGGSAVTSGGSLEGVPAIAYVAALVFGLADSAFNANSYAMCGQLFGGGSDAQPRSPTASVGAFTVFQLFQNAGSAIWYGVNIALPVHDAPGVPGSYTQLWVQAAFLVVVATTFVALDLRSKRAAVEELLLQST